MKIAVLFSILSLKSVMALAGLDDRAQKMGYMDAQDILVRACLSKVDYSQVSPTCNAFIQKLRAGYLVNRDEYNSWCGMATNAGNRLKAHEKNYKKVTGRKVDYRKCPMETQVGSQNSYDAEVPPEGR